MPTKANKAIIPVNDYWFGAINNQWVHRGTALTEVFADRVYFVTNVIGNSVTIKDGAGNTVLVTNTASFLPGVRVDGGIDIAASAACTVTFFWVTI